MVTYCGRLYVTTFTFSELSSTHVFTYNGQWIMSSANWHSCQYQKQSSCLYVPHYTYVYNYSCYTVTHLSNGSYQYWYRTLYEYYISMRPMSQIQHTAYMIYGASNLMHAWSSCTNSCICMHSWLFNWDKITWKYTTQNYRWVSFVLLQVVAHEISHSWTGNLVTNRTWEEFWSV